MNKLFAVYILTNNLHTVLYVGVTNNLKRRIYEHKVHIGSTFTTKYRVDKLVYYEVHEAPLEAIKREKTLKNLVRRKKEILIEKNNHNWEDLYKTL